MKPVYQTKFGEGKGNCFPACLASLMEIPLENIPEFHEENWLQQTDKFLQQYGYTYVEFEIENSKMTWFGECYCILCGLSPRNIQHAMIGYHYMPNRLQHHYQFVFDPHPDGGNVEPEMVGFLLPTWKTNNNGGTTCHSEFAKSP